MLDIVTITLIGICMAVLCLPRIHPQVRQRLRQPARKRARRGVFAPASGSPAAPARYTAMRALD
jgi:hypothetical protein